MAVTLRYFTEFGKLALQKTICGGIYARVYCIFSACTMSSKRKFTFAISSPDEFLVAIGKGSIYLCNCLLIIVERFQQSYFTAEHPLNLHSSLNESRRKQQSLKQNKWSRDVTINCDTLQLEATWRRPIVLSINFTMSITHLHAKFQQNRTIRGSRFNYYEYLALPRPRSRDLCQRLQPLYNPVNDGHMTAYLCVMSCKFNYCPEYMATKKPTKMPKIYSLLVNLSFVRHFGSDRTWILTIPRPPGTHIAHIAIL